MEVEFDINADDHFALYAHRFREATPRKRRGRCPWWAWLILVLFLGFLILGSLTSGGPTINLPQSPLQVILIGIVLSLILLTVLGPRMLALLKYHLVKKRLREAENRGESLRIYFRITAEGLALTNEQSKLSIGWNGVKRIVVTGQHAFFFTTPDYAYILPRRAFQNEADFEAFLGKAREYRRQAGVVDDDTSSD